VIKQWGESRKEAFSATQKSKGAKNILLGTEVEKNGTCRENNGAKKGRPFVGTRRVGNDRVNRRTGRCRQ